MPLRPFHLALVAASVAAAVTLERSCRRRVDAAILDERRRMSRDLHDGLAQDLAFVSAQARMLAHRLGEQDDVEQLTAAAERALEEARGAIAALARPSDERLHAALAAAAEDIAARGDADVVLELAQDVDVPPATQAALVRIVREAVTNATRHGNAGSVSVRLATNGSLRLEIADDGCGFDASRGVRPGRFGLASMADRVAALGGRFDVWSQPGSGTRVKVVLP